MALPPVVDYNTWRKELDELRVREKAATKELDATAAQRRRLPMVKLPDYTLASAEGPVRLTAHALPAPAATGRTIRRHDVEGCE